MLILITGLMAFGQTKPRLGILPFTGGSAGDAEVITTLLTFQNDIMEAFTVVPRTNAVTASVMDPAYQLSGYPDSDNIARLGRMLNAEFVLAGYIRNMGTSYLILANVIKVETLELLGGDYRIFRRTEDIPVLLPDIAGNIISATRRNTFDLPKLAVAPFNIAQGVSVPEVETLAQVLAIEIVNSGKYALLPRTTTLQAAKKGLDNQNRSYTAEQAARTYGQAVNSRYVLDTYVQKLGTMNMMTASIMNIDNGRLETEANRNYRSISDGLIPMEELAMLLTGSSAPPAVAAAPQVYIPEPLPIPEPEPVLQPVPESPLVISDVPPSPESELTVESAPAIAPPPPPAPRAAPPPPVPPASPKTDPAKYWTVGFGVGSSFAVPWAIATIHGTIAPIKYMFLDIGCDLGFITLNDKVDFYFSVYPFAHLALFLPFGEKGGWFFGAGGGYMMGFYYFPLYDEQQDIFAADIITGFNFFNILEISYTLRAAPWKDLKSMSHKASIGFTYRF